MEVVTGAGNSDGHEEDAREERGERFVPEIEYKNTTTGNNALYLLGSNPQEYTVAANSFSFTGNGNWSNPSNWSNSLIPPSTLPQGSQIIINPSAGGECVLDVQQKIASSASVTVQAGKKFVVQGNLVIQ